MLSFKEFLDNHKDPWYVCVDPDEHTKRTLALHTVDAGVPNAYSPMKMHCTLIYSMKPTDPPRVNPGMVYQARFENWHVFDPRDGKNVLVAKLTSPKLEARHQELMKDMGASYDFDKYLPHVTVSNDIGKFDITKLKPITTPMFFSNEKSSVLNQGYE